MKKISGEIFGYVIRHPGEPGEMRYIIGDPEELKEKYYEGFNPVCALVRLDKGLVSETDCTPEGAESLKHKTQPSNTASNGRIV